MGTKIVLASIFSIQMFLVLIVASILYTYWYPWLYNNVNDTTKRGQNIATTIDPVNSFIMMFVTGLLVGVTSALVGLITIQTIKRVKRKSK